MNSYKTKSLFCIELKISKQQFWFRNSLLIFHESYIIISIPKTPINSCATSYTIYKDICVLCTQNYIIGK